MDSITIHRTNIKTSVAISDAEKAKGLSGIDEPYPLLFWYSEPKIKKFWMKNTRFPLDIIFCCDGAIIAIEKGEPESTVSLGPNEPSDIVIELPHGTVEKYGFKPGQKISFEPSLETLIKLLKFSR